MEKHLCGEVRQPDPTCIQSNSIIKKCQDQNMTLVGILATESVLTTTPLVEQLIQHGIEPIYPIDAESVQSIDTIIHELAADIADADSYSYIIGQTQGMIDAGAEAIILGSPNLHMLLAAGDDTLGVPILDLYPPA